METTKDAVFRAFCTVNYPGFTRDIVSLGWYGGVLMEGTTARIRPGHSSSPQALTGR